MYFSLFVFTKGGSMKNYDYAGYRKPDDVPRRWDLQKIELNSEDIKELQQEVICDDHLSTTSTAPVQNKVVTAAINTKVTKVTGKDLSTNDFTDTYKGYVDSAHTNEHTHTNKTILDGITTSSLYDEDKVYPVGCVYFETTNTNPGTTLGGTWTSVGTTTIGSTTIYVWTRTV